MLLVIKGLSNCRKKTNFPDITGYRHILSGAQSIIQLYCVICQVNHSIIVDFFTMCMMSLFLDMLS